MQEVGDRDWKEIVDSAFLFDRREKEVYTRCPFNPAISFLYCFIIKL